MRVRSWLKGIAVRISTRLPIISSAALSWPEMKQDSFDSEPMRASEVVKPTDVFCLSLSDVSDGYASAAGRGSACVIMVKRSADP